MKASDSKYYNTACLMDEALLLLLEEKDYEYITVKEICKKAGVNRSTYYLHYETIDDLLQESLTFIFSKFTEKYQGIQISEEEIKNTPTDKLILLTPEYIKPYLEFLKRYKRIFLIAIQKPNVFKVGEHYESISKRIFEPIMERFEVDECERRYLISFYNRGIHAIILEWIKNGCIDGVDFITGLIIKYALPK